MPDHMSTYRKYLLPPKPRSADFQPVPASAYGTRLADSVVLCGASMSANRCERAQSDSRYSTDAFGNGEGTESAQRQTWSLL